VPPTCAPRRRGRPRRPVVRACSLCRRTRAALPALPALPCRTRQLPAAAGPSLPYSAALSAVALHGTLPYSALPSGATAAVGFGHGVTSRFSEKANGTHPSCADNPKTRVLQHNLWVNWDSAPDPGIFEAWAPVFQGNRKEESRCGWATGQVLGRTVGRVIPCQVASPQSPLQRDPPWRTRLCFTRRDDCTVELAGPTSFAPEIKHRPKFR